MVLLLWKHSYDCDYGMSSIGMFDTMVAMGIMNDIMNNIISTKTS